MYDTIRGRKLAAKLNDLHDEIHAGAHQSQNGQPGDPSPIGWASRKVSLVRILALLGMVLPVVITILDAHHLPPEK